MESRFIRVLVTLGVPGVSLGLFFLLLRAFSFQFSQISATWSAAITIIFLLMVAAVTLSALHRWTPISPKKDNLAGGSEVGNPAQHGTKKLNFVRDVSDEEFNELLTEIERCLKSTVLPKHQHYDAYISCPMASCEPTDREHLKSDLSRVIISLQKMYKLRDIECPAVIQTDSNEDDKFDDPQKALKLCYKRILYSKRFILVYPKKTPTSSIFEVGLAMAFCKPITIFLKRGVELPFLLQKIDKLLDNAHIYIYENTLSEIETKIVKKEVVI